MANVPITAGSGTVIATDVVTADSSNVQIIELGTVAAGVLTRTPVPPLGAALSAASLPVVLATDGVTIGPTNETAPTNDTNASGLNGRLQRIAQRLTSLIALLPAALGGGGGLKVEGVGTAGTPAGGVMTVQGAAGGRIMPTVIGVGALPQTPFGYVTIAGDGTGASWPLAAAGYEFDGTNVVSLRTPAVFHSAVATAAGNTAVWTPTSGKKFRLMRFMLVLTDEAARAAAGDITVKFQDATTDIGIGLPVYVPAAAIAAPIGEAWSSGWIDIGNGYLSAAANNVLNVNLSAALTAGTFGVIAAGTEE